MSGTRVEFEKWEGLGNDFVLVEAESIAWSNDVVRAVCDRRRGVGADGVLFIDRGGLFDDVISSRNERAMEAPPTTRRSAFPEALAARDERNERSWEQAPPPSRRSVFPPPEPIAARDERNERSWEQAAPTSRRSAFPEALAARDERNERSWDLPPPTSRRSALPDVPASRAGRPYLPERASDLNERGFGREAARAVRAPRMVVRNADGSRPEMCGNGIRCVAGYLASHGADPGPGGALMISTDAGPKRCEVTWEGGQYTIAVEMGPAKLRGTLMVEIDGRAHTFTCADVGNPHAITFGPYSEAAIDRIGPIVATYPPGGTNVEFCRIVRSLSTRIEAIDVTVWERGVGRTLACGTGACAVASAACAAGYRAYGAPLRVRLPGGELTIVVESGSHAATMRGPARRVFSGTLELP